MKKEFLTGLTAMVLAIGLVIVGCDDGSTDSGGGGSQFTSATNDATLNDVATLGFVGTGVSSSTTVATAAIVSGKIAITSKRTGDTVITVHYGPFTSTIPVSVDNLGAIELGAITKEVVRDITPGGPTTAYSLTTATTTGIEVTKVEAAGSAGWSGYKVLITLGGTIPNANRGKSGSTDTNLSDVSLYGTSRYEGGDASPNTEFARIGIRSIGDVVPAYDSANTFKYNWVTMTNWPLAEWYRMAWIQPGKTILDYKDTGSPGPLAAGVSPIAGQVRYTGATLSAPYNNATASDAFISAGGNYTFLLWEKDPGKVLTLQFDGGKSAGDYSLPGGLPTNPNGKLAWIDYSGVTWLSE
jgi:hypothetical protein